MAPSSKDSGSSRTWIHGELRSKPKFKDNKLVLKFLFPSSAPDFSFIWQGQVTSGGKIDYITRLPDVAGTGSERLLIATYQACFTID
jgi:hypothetical protein